MRILKLVWLLFMLGILSCKNEPIEKPIYTAAKWENPEIFEINSEQPVASFYKYPDAGSALKNESWQNSPFYKEILLILI